jgi:hypothetical protein
MAIYETIDRGLYPTFKWQFVWSQGRYFTRNISKIVLVELQAAGSLGASIMIHMATDGWEHDALRRP